MKKHLLFALAMVASVMSANAYEVNDYVFTNTGRYQIVDANLVKNGDFSAKFANWTSTNSEETPDQVFTVEEGTGPAGANTIKVIDGQNALTSGVYQVVDIDAGGTYVITMKVANMGVGGYSDLDLTGNNTNYINAYFNTDGALASADGTNLLYGTDGVCAGYGVTIPGDSFGDVVFAVDAPSDGKIVVDFRGLATGLEIACVEVHMAQQVYDIRLPQARINWINTIINSGVEFVDEDALNDVKDAIADVETGIESEDWDNMELLMQNLNDMIDLFLVANAENVIDLVPTKDGSANTGNNSANWMNWTAKYNKLSSEYKGQAPWSWSTDRWAHKNASANSPMTITWMRKSSGTWDNIATLTTTLEKGTYFWGVSGSGGMMTLNKDRWARSMAKECAETQLFFAGDTIDIGTLNPAREQDYICKFELAEDGEVTLGIRCNLDYDVNPATEGFDVAFYSPVLYKMMVAGALTEAEKAYLNKVDVQMEALKGRIDVANGYVAPEQKELPWGKDELAAGATEAQARYDVWAALTQAEKLEMMYNFEELADTIMNNGVRFLNNNYINPFVAKNKPLTDMPTAIASAQNVLVQRIYGSGDKATFEALIASAQNLYDATVVAPFSSADSLALVDKKAELEAGVNAFKASISSQVACEISFGTDAAPQTIVEVEDPTGETDTYWYLQGENGSIVFENADLDPASTVIASYRMGYTDGTLMNYLRFGASKATVDLAGVPVAESDIVSVSFDIFFGNLSGKQNGFFLTNAAGDCLASVFYSTYSNTVANYTIDGVELNGDVFDMMTTDGLANCISGVGSSSASNAAIAADDNRTTFEIVLDFGAREKYLVITNPKKGTHQSQVLSLSGADAPAKLYFCSNYNNADRRSWIKNIKVTNIAAEQTAVNGVAEAKAAVAPAKHIENNKLVIEKDGKLFNAAGAQIK